MICVLFLTISVVLTFLHNLWEEVVKAIDDAVLRALMKTLSWFCKAFGILMLLMFVVAVSFMAVGYNS
jgi:hypothetical protein